MSGCIFTYDPLPGSLYIRNDSDEAIYVYRKYGSVDLLPSSPKLQLFHYLPNMEDARGNPIDPHVSPDYRINAYAFGSMHISGSPKKPSLAT